MAISKDRTILRFNQRLARIIDLYWTGKLSAIMALDQIAKLPR